MPITARHRFNVAEYHRMADAGILAPDARLELVNGEIIDMSPIGPFHGGVTKQLIQLLTAAANGRWLVAAQDPVRLDDHSEPQPDIALLKPRADFYRKGHPSPEDVYLLIEVSEASLALDRQVKLPAYGKSGIPEVWIVNLADEVIEVYREPHFAGYNSEVVLRSGDQAQPQAFPDVAIEVASLLRR